MIAFKGSNSEEIKKCECEACKNGIEAALKRDRELFDKCGWYAHIVGDDSSMPFGVNYHTHGLEQTFKHLNLHVCLPLNPNVTHAIVTDMVEEIRKGRVYSPDKLETDVIKGKSEEEMPVAFMKMVLSGKDYLRIIFPDEQGKVLKDEISEKYRKQWDI